MFQSAYRQNHSTETALIKVMNDIFLNMNNQRVTLLILLDLSAAFDTVDHDTMLRRLDYSFGIQGKALSWFASYLSGRTHRIMINESLSKPFKLECGVPQGFCLGPLLFTLYTSELFEIIKYHLPMIHCYADDSQVYISFSPNDRAEQQKFCRVTPLFYELHWLPIKYRIEFKILLITFKILNFLGPTYLWSLISHRLPSKYNLRNSSDKLLLSYPRFKSKATLGDRSFTCAAPKLWNVLPFDIRSASTVSSFKAKLKTHLFRRAFLT